MELLDHIIKRSFAAFGINISRLAPPMPSPLVQHKIDLVFDVGANVGQFALLARKEGFRGRMVSFEPLPDAHGVLQKKAARDPLWTIHPRCAVGSAEGVTRINVSQNSFSSSLLPMLDAHSSAAPESIYIDQVETGVITLDSVFDSYCQGGDRVFLKIDTQGFEAEVLKGVSSRLSRVTGVQLELSLVPLYEGQELYRHFLDFFEEKGFVLWSLMPGFVDRNTGRLLQFDAVFIRSADTSPTQP